MNRRVFLASIATVSASRAPRKPPPRSRRPLIRSLRRPRPERSVGGAAKAYQRHNRRRLAVVDPEPIAPPKANNALLKQFVEFEIAEQETVADILNTLQTGGATGSIQAPTDAELSRNLDDAAKASVETLRSLSAGPKFDHDYIQYEVEGHRKLLDIQEVYLRVHDNLDQTNVAKLARGMIKEHLTLLAGVQKVG